MRLFLFLVYLLVVLSTSAKEENEFVLQHPLFNKIKSYEIHSLKHENGRRFLESKGDHHLTYEFEAFGKRLNLKMEKITDLFSNDYKHFIQDIDTNEIIQENNNNIEMKDDIKHCFYKAIVNDNPNLYGTVNLCGNGFQAVLRHDDIGIFSVEPVDDKGENHAIYRHLDLADNQSGSCGLGKYPEFRESSNRRQLLRSEKTNNNNNNNNNNFQYHSMKQFYTILNDGRKNNNKIYNKLFEEEEEEEDDDEANNSKKHIPFDPARSRKLANGTPKKLVRIFVVNDLRHYQQFTTRTQAHAAQLVLAMKDLYVTFPGDYSFDFQITGMMTFSKKDPYTPTTNEKGEASASDLLAKFNSWRATGGSAHPSQVSAGMLLTGYNLDADTIGLAYLDRVCFSDTKSSIVQIDSLVDPMIAATMAHEFGHNLGIEHSDEELANSLVTTSCYVQAVPKIMDAISTGSASSEWSPCNAGWVKMHMEGHPPAAKPILYGQNGANYCMEDCKENGPSVPNCVGAPDWVPPKCGDGFREGVEQCDCPNNECDGIDPCCDGDSCTLIQGKQCSAIDPCCTSSCLIETSTSKVCRAETSKCDLEEVCDGVKAACPTDVFLQTGAPCKTATVGGFDGRCYFKKCRSQDALCMVYSGSIVNGVVHNYNGACSGYGATGGNIACGQLRCANANGGGSCDKFDTVYVQDGSPCATDKACYKGDCVPFSQVLLPASLNCSNGIKDGEELDVDCGGSDCGVGCKPGTKCYFDRDCIFPSICNITAEQQALALSLNITVNGTCSGSTKGGLICYPTCPQWVEDALQIILKNAIVIGSCLGALLLICLLYCCWPRSSTYYAKEEPVVVHHQEPQPRPMSTRPQSMNNASSHSYQSPHQGIDHSSQIMHQKEYRVDSVETYPVAKFAGPE